MMESIGMIKAYMQSCKNHSSMRCFALTLLLLVMLSVSSAAPLWAKNEGPNIPISIVNGATSPDTATLLADDQQNPFVIAVPDKNKWFVVWEDWRNWSTTGADIYGRFINADGTYCGNEIAISTAAGNQTVPTMAYRNDPANTNDNILIAWQDTRGVATSGFLYYKILDISSLAADCSSGAILSIETAFGYTSIGGDSLISRKFPKVAYDTVRDQFWLAWVESRDALQRIEERPFGIAPGTTFWNFGDANSVGYGTVNAVTGASIGFDIIRNRGTYVRTVRMLSHSTTATEDVYVYEYFKDINNVTVACDESSPETLIVWEGVRGRATLTCTYKDAPDPDDGPDFPDFTDIFSAEMVLDNWDGDVGQVHIFSIFDKYIDQGTVHSQLVDASTKSSYYPAVGFDIGHRKFLVAWEDRDARNGASDGIHSKIFGQLLYSGGGLYSSNIPISFQDTNNDGIQDENILNSNQTRPQVSIDTTNQRFFVTWQDGRNSQVSLENLDIYGQFVDSEGSLRGNNYAVCVESANQYNPVTAFNTGSHQFLSVWKDARYLNDTNSDIFGQLFTLGQPQLIMVGENGQQLQPPFINYPAIEVGQSSSVNISMKNVGDTVIAIDEVSALTKNPPFSFVNLPTELESADGDTIDLVPGASYPLNVKFEPVETGVFIDEFTIKSDSTALKVNLQGRALAAPPDVNTSLDFNPRSFDFGEVKPGETKFDSLAVTNNGTTTVVINTVEVPNGFSAIGLEGLRLSPGETVHPIVRFIPKQERSYQGSIFVAYTGGAFAIPVSGVGVGGESHSEIVPSPLSFNFGSVFLDDTVFDYLTIANNGDNPVQIGEVELPKGFSVIGLKGVIVNPGSVIHPIIKFTPQQARPYKGNMFVTYKGAISVDGVYLYNYGSGGAFQLTLEGVGDGNVIVDLTPPENTNFGNTEVGDSKSANLTFINNGNVDIKITAVDIPDGSGFSISGIPATIPANETFTALAVFKPVLAQVYSKTLRILYDHGVPTSEITLSGVGVYNVGNVIEVADEVNLGSCNTGESKSANLRFINKGSVAVKITAVDLPDGVFAVSGIPGNIPAYGVLDALVTFAPLLEKDYDVTMRVLYDQGVVTSDIKLKASGVDISEPAISVAPQSFSFGRVGLGTTKTDTLVVTNTGNVDLEIVGIDLPGALFAVEGIGNGTLAAGMSTVAIVTFTPVAVGDFSGTLRLLFNHDLAPQEIIMQGSCVDIDVSPTTLEFPNSDIGSNTVLDVTITNSSAEDIQVKGAVTGTESYSVSGIVAGDIIRASGGSLTCQVTFNPAAPGYLEDGLYLNVGPVQDLENIPFDEIDWGTQYVVLLKGVANADFVVSDFDTFTADADYKVAISASTASKGQLFVLFSHDPLSKGDIYALTPNGSLKLFPYKAFFGWQNLWYKAGAMPGMKLDLSQVDFRELGCSQCQGEKVDSEDNDFHFGNIIITPPNNEPFNNASDFKYMPGTLYMGTYVKDANSSGAFDFNKGLLEMQSLHINSLAGIWQVTSSYYGADRIHPTNLVVTEDGDGNISAFWPGYNVSLAYADDASGYVMTFSVGIYHYTYNITSLTEKKFTGTYTCIANGEVLEDAPMSGVRLK